MMDMYRIEKVGKGYVIFVGDIGILECQTEGDAKRAILSTAINTGDLRALSKSSSWKSSLATTEGLGGRYKN